jgi:hypothetical protein
MSADVGELLTLASAIAASGARLEVEGRAVVSRGALNVKNDWRANAAATAGRHARLYPSSISYDIAGAAGIIEAEIGPDKARPQGPLGNLLEFGSINNPPHNDGGKALDAEEPRFVAQAEVLAERAARL